MIRTCDDCHSVYDDARQVTLCPHDKLMSDADMDRKIRAIDLMNRSQGRYVKFVDGYEFHPSFQQSKDGRYQIMAIGWDGMVTLVGVDWDFPPGLFEVVD